MITITDSAKQKLSELWAAKNESSLSLLIAITGRGATEFDYAMRFVEEEERQGYDSVDEIGDLKVFVDPESVDNLKGATIDFLASGGFRIDNPNPVWVWSDPQAQRIQDVLTSEINPAVASHGGNVRLLDVKDNVAYIELGGGCVGCGLVDVTLKQGIEVAIKAAVPEIVSVIDQTDHASGTNPYYQETKGGGHHQPTKGAPQHQPQKGGPPPQSPFE